MSPSRDESPDRAAKYSQTAFETRHATRRACIRRRADRPGLRVDANPSQTSQARFKFFEAAPNPRLHGAERYLKDIGHFAVALIAQLGQRHSLSLIGFEPLH